jgi:hypothetical protein
MIAQLSIARGHCLGAIALALALAQSAHAADSTVSGSRNWTVVREATTCYAAFLGNRDIRADNSTLSLKFPAETHAVAVAPIFGWREMTAAEKAQHAVVLSGAAYQRFVASASVQVMEARQETNRFERKVDTMGLNATLAMAAACAGTTSSPPSSPASPTPPAPPTVSGIGGQGGVGGVGGTAVAAPQPVGTQCSAALVARLKALPLSDALIAQVCK